MLASQLEQLPDGSVAVSFFGTTFRCASAAAARALLVRLHALMQRNGQLDVRRRAARARFHDDLAEFIDQIVLSFAVGGTLQSPRRNFEAPK